MSESVLTIALYLAVAWPLFLALPAIHSRLRWAVYLAIVPAAILLLIRGEIHVMPPWFMFHAGLAVEGSSTRWLLGMAVVIWLIAARFSAPYLNHENQRNMTVFFMLTMAGNFGVILSADLVAFFFFSTLMSYSLYGLVMTSVNEPTCGAARLYIMFLVAADLLLFEALLIAASVSENLQFDAIHKIMVDHEVADFFIWITFIGFALKAAIWPAHIWLSAILNVTVNPVRLLLGGVPIAMAILGLMRWLPLGEAAYVVIGNTLQVLGVLAVIYAVTMSIIRRDRLLMPLWSIMVMTGLLNGALGTVLTNPDTWLDYGHFVYPLIAALGIFSAMVCIGTRSEYRHEYMAEDTFNRWITVQTEKCQHLFNHTVARMVIPSAREKATGRLYLERLGKLGATLDSAERLLGGWRVAITLVVLLAILIVYSAHIG